MFFANMPGPARRLDPARLGPARIGPARAGPGGPEKKYGFLKNPSRARGGVPPRPRHFRPAGPGR